jgi:hypothetical protein
MADDGAIGAIKGFLDQNPSDEISIPDGGDAEAVHAV